MPFGQVTAAGARVSVAAGVAVAAVAVAVGVSVELAVDVAVDVGKTVAVSVSVGEGVMVGPSNPPGPHADASRQTATKANANLRFIKVPPSICI